MIGKVDHIGIAVSDLEAALRVYRDVLGLALEQIEEVGSQKVLSYHLRVGESHLELLAPSDPDSVIARFLEKKGAGIHHLALAVDDLDEARARLIAAGCEPIGEPSTGANGKRIQFFHPRTTGGVLLEICTPAG
ncbi:MAG: methylmalonyl-CoA epimerase [Candidatus Eisenbacteria bacterium]|nr:methylmalonyl-CoA epimerase [Candidatus Eisenbacteria bacterium]